MPGRFSLNVVGTSDWDLGLDVQVKNLDETILQMQTLVPEVRASLEPIIRKGGEDIRDRARALASGDLLQSRTGRYVNSIQTTFISDKTGVFAKISSDDPRAGLFEYGGSQKPRDILPNVAQALRFAGWGFWPLPSSGEVYAAIVHRPAVTYEKRPAIHEAFDEANTDLGFKVGNAVITGVETSEIGRDIQHGSHQYTYTP